MKNSFSRIALCAFLALGLNAPLVAALAADPQPLPTVAPSPVAIDAGAPAASPAPPQPAPVVEEAAPQEMPVSDFLSQVLQVIKEFGGLPTVLKIAAIITLLISSMKVSVLNELVWSKLGDFKPWAAPILGLIAGILDLAKAGTVSWASVFAYISAGAGALILHDLLDSVKAIPKLGAVYVKLIELVQKALGPAATKKSAKV